MYTQYSDSCTKNSETAYRKPSVRCLDALDTGSWGAGPWYREKGPGAPRYSLSPVASDVVITSQPKCVVVEVVMKVRGQIRGQ